MKAAFVKWSGATSAVVLICGAALAGAQDLAKGAGLQAGKSGVGMRITLTSVMVEDQERALEFYTKVLGFVKKVDLPAGGARWLTVVSPEQPAGPELLLEPIGFPPARTYQKALFDAGIPLTSFEVRDIAGTYQKLTALGVAFRGEPAKAGPVTVAVFEDTCGNLIQLVQK